MHRPHSPAGSAVPKQALKFNKVFRWEPATPADAPASTVEVVGTFSQWEAIPLEKEATGNFWQLSLKNLPGNCTHRYMILVDGKPAKDPHADGLAIPENDQEKSWALATPRGPRLFMLFSQTK